jgi:hypothetical protein
MTSEIDQRIAAFLNANAPPERDPMFRIQLLARRERQRFKRRALLILCTAFAFVAIVLTGYSARASLVETASMVLLGLSLAGLALGFPVVLHALRRTQIKRV